MDQCPFRKGRSWQSVFNTSAIYYSIALVKNTAPEHLQPQSTSAVGLIFTRPSPLPFSSDYKAPRKSRDLDRVQGQPSPSINILVSYSKKLHFHLHFYTPFFINFHQFLSLLHSFLYHLNKSRDLDRVCLLGLDHVIYLNGVIIDENGCKSDKKGVIKVQVKVQPLLQEIGMFVGGLG